MTWRRIGILGGCFDPPQLGHLVLAEYSCAALGIDHVLFVPVADHPFKHDRTRHSVAHRLAMLQLAIADNDRFSISRVDIDREGPHYSVDTARIIQRLHPDADLYFLMGGDNLRELPSWEQAQELYTICRLAVMKRANEEVAPDMHAASLPGLAEKVDMVQGPLQSRWLSSSLIAQRLRDGESVRYLVPTAVHDYIAAHALYR